MRTKITDELIKKCMATESLKSCDECACNEQECIGFLLELVRGAE